MKSDDLQLKIDIIKKSIKLYEEIVEKYPSETNIKMLEMEKNNLKNYIEKYPEYFI